MAFYGCNETKVAALIITDGHSIDTFLTFPHTAQGIAAAKSAMVEKMLSGHYDDIDCENWTPADFDKITEVDKRIDWKYGFMELRY